MADNLKLTRRLHDDFARGDMPAILKECWPQPYGWAIPAWSWIHCRP
jgi:hypothetical protein